MDEITLLGDYGTTQHTLTSEEVEELVTQINRTNRLHFQKNKHLEGPTPACGITLSVDGTDRTLWYYGIFELRYGEHQWWIRSERFAEFMESLLEKYDIPCE